MMTRKVIVECIKRQLPNKPIKIIFKKDGEIGFRRLVLMIARQKVDVQGMDRSKVLTMFDDRHPNTDEDRTMEVFKFKEVDEESLLCIAEGIQSISTSSHIASELFSIVHEPDYLHNSSSFKGIIEDFVNSVLNQSITELVSSLGYHVTGHFACFDCLPAVVFTVTNKTGDILVNVGIDFWSGRYSINGVWRETTVGTKECVHQRIYSATVDAIDALRPSTVPA